MSGKIQPGSLSAFAKAPEKQRIDPGPLVKKFVASVWAALEKQDEEEEAKAREEQIRETIALTYRRSQHRRVTDPLFIDRIYRLMLQESDG